MLLTSATYGQSSRRKPAHKNTPLASQSPDPETHTNPFTPFSRVRLSAEMIRDQALAVSGLLADRLGGPSVKPYQPDGLWDEIAGVTTSIYKDGYQTASGEDLYRRSLYTFWRRTIHPPGMEVFDAPSREFCTIRRISTNTPLQALVLLNDPTYVEAARALGERIMKEGGDDAVARIRWAFLEALSRPPSDRELKIVSDLQVAQLKRYLVDGAAGKQLLSGGLRPAPTELPVAELASWTTVARTILNLHEAITRQ